MENEGPFIYDKCVAGKNFVGRKDDRTVLRNLIGQKENVVIMGGAKTGKMSLVSQVLFDKKVSGEHFCVAELSLLDIRSTEAFLCRLGDSVLRAVATTPDEYSGLIGTFLSGTHFVFDRRRFSEKDEIVSLNWNVDEKDARKMLLMPFELSFHKGIHIIILVEEFQNMDFFAEGELNLYRLFEDSLKDIRGRLDEPMANFVFMGSRTNAMKDIFCHRHRFHRLVELYYPTRIDEKDIVAFVDKGFRSVGKVFDKENIIGVCKLFDNSMWYINHFMSICDHLTRGYINESVLAEALEKMVSLHQPSFVYQMGELTTFQVNLLRAIIDGNTKISGADIIKDYNLNSAANVKRLKDALVKKEIISFDDKDNPVLIDPLFSYWLQKFYFKKNI